MLHTCMYLKVVFEKNGKVDICYDDVNWSQLSINIKSVPHKDDDAS